MTRCDSFYHLSIDDIDYHVKQPRITLNEIKELYNIDTNSKFEIITDSNSRKITDDEILSLGIKYNYDGKIFDFQASLILETVINPTSA